MEETPADPTLQQLREELLARLWAMQTISPTTLTGDVRREVAQHVADASARWWRKLCDADPTVRRQAASAIERILWPAFSAPADEWWTTPLGAALLSARSERPRHRPPTSCLPAASPRRVSSPADAHVVLTSAGH